MTDASSSISSQLALTNMTLKGLRSRLTMLPKVLDIALRSLRTGVYVKPAKFLKFDADFERLLATGDPNRGTTVTQDESYTIYSSVLATSRLPGSIAELGVYQGSTARLIAEAKGDKKLFLLDTFSGMPNDKISGNKDDWELNTHRDTSLAHVKNYLSKYSGVIYIDGTFPESINESARNLLIREETFCLVNLDVDLYQSTLDGLNFFFPRLVEGGRLISHNYNLKDSPGGRTPGVKEAFNRYFRDKEHKIIEIAETQCMVIK